MNRPKLGETVSLAETVTTVIAREDPATRLE